MLRVQEVPMLADNYSWLIVTPGGTVAIVDPAEAEPALAALGPERRLDWVLLTHHHADHIGGAEALREATGARIAGAAADAHRLPRLDAALAEGDVFALGDVEARVIATPGHTLGHIALYCPAGPALFCGDTLFSLGCGRLFEGTAAQMFGSLAKFADLPDETLVYAGHEYTESNARFALSVDPHNEKLAERAREVARLRASGKPTLPVTLGSERRTNPFLRAPDAASLGVLREKKDRF